MEIDGESGETTGNLRALSDGLRAIDPRIVAVYSTQDALLPGPILSLSIASTRVQDAAHVELPTLGGIAKMLGAIDISHKEIGQQRRKQRVGPVENAIRHNVTPGMTLGTIPNGAPFRIGAIDDECFTIYIGAEGTLTQFKWQCLEDVVPFLKTRATTWVKIGSVLSVFSKPGTLDKFLKTNGPNRMTSSYIAAVLERAGIVQARTTRPAAVRLREGR